MPIGLDLVVERSEHFGDGTLLREGHQGYPYIGERSEINVRHPGRSGPTVNLVNHRGIAKAVVNISSVSLAGVRSKSHLALADNVGVIRSRRHHPNLTESSSLREDYIPGLG
jgi:hypothetical protein